MDKGSAKKRSTIFKDKWLSLYGLLITVRDLKTSVAVSVKCRFFEFGRDDLNYEERKWKSTKHIKDLKAPWHTDNINRHLEEQHKLPYEEYSKLSGEDKSNYFQDLE